MMTLEQMEDAIKRKENLIELLESEISELRLKHEKVREYEDKQHLITPTPGHTRNSK